MLDTNVLISALLSPYRTAAQVVDLAVTGEITALFDDRVTAEYWAVVTRPRLAIAPRDAARVLGGITRTGEHVVARPFPVQLPDPDDVAFAEVALAGRADALVTGNARHFVPAGNLIRVRSPRELLDELRTRD